MQNAEYYRNVKNPLKMALSASWEVPWKGILPDLLKNFLHLRKPKACCAGFVLSYDVKQDICGRKCIESTVGEYYNEIAYVQSGFVQAA